VKDLSNHNCWYKSHETISNIFFYIYYSQNVIFWPITTKETLGKFTSKVATIHMCGNSHLVFHDEATVWPEDEHHRPTPRRPIPALADTSRLGLFRLALYTHNISHCLHFSRNQTLTNWKFSNGLFPTII